MTIDIQRLATDAAYWDECEAPEGATHYCPEVEQGFFRLNFEKNACHHCIPRPQKPEVERDGEGLPPVGCECEVQVQEGEPWYVVEIIAHYDGSAVFIAGDDYPHGVYDGCSHHENFRPIRTKEKRQRDELVDFVAAASGIRARDGRGAIALDIADAILSRYNLEPKDV